MSADDYNLKLSPSSLFQTYTRWFGRWVAAATDRLRRQNTSGPTYKNSQAAPLNSASKTKSILHHPATNHRRARPHPPLLLRLRSVPRPLLHSIPFLNSHSPSQRHIHISYKHSALQLPTLGQQITIIKLSLCHTFHARSPWADSAS